MKLPIILLFSLLLPLIQPCLADTGETSDKERLAALEKRLDSLVFDVDRVMKKVDDLLWFERIGDLAEIDKVFIPTVPNPHGKETYGISNERHPFKMYAYVFVPRSLDRSRRHPLLMLPHGGVHGDFNTYYTHRIPRLDRLRQGLLGIHRLRRPGSPGCRRRSRLGARALRLPGQ